MTNGPISSPHTGTCRLCLGAQPLVKSHIIPDFQFKPLKAKEGLFYVVSPDPQKPERKQQRGFVERLLCAQCDGVRLGQNEAYLAKALERGPGLKMRRDGVRLLIEGHDYKRIKNCLLSILWRMSLSSLDIFKDVKLKPEDEETLRLSLLQDREFGEDEYPIMVTAPLFEGKHQPDWIVEPDHDDVDGNRIFRCLVSGLMYTYFVGPVPLAPEMQPLLLTRALFPILRLEVRDIPFLADAVHKWGRANATRAANRTGK